MDFFRPLTWTEALEIKAAHPEVLPIAGGTDVMVEINFDKRRPAGLLDLTGIPELAEWSRADDAIEIGAGVSYTRLISELGELLPGLAMASRTIGSPQIRNRGTIGGNLGSASPAGDCHPVLLACDAIVTASSVRGDRAIPTTHFFTGPKRSALEPDELIRSVRVPAEGRSCQFAKIGTRNAMVIAVCSFSVAVDVVRRTAHTGIGSAAPTPIRAYSAEQYLVQELDWTANQLPPEVVHRFGQLVAQAATPIDDVRGSAAYRRHALAILARRTLTWACDAAWKAG